MPNQPFDINVGITKGAIDAEIEKIVGYAQTGINIQLGISNNGLSAITNQLAAIRSQSLFDVAKVTREISAVSSQLSALQKQASGIQIGGIGGGGGNGLILPASYTSGLQNIANQAQQATSAVTTLGNAIGRTARSLANLSIKKDIGGTDQLISGANTSGVNRLLRRADTIETKIRNSSPFQAREAILQEAAIQKEVRAFQQQSFGSELLGSFRGTDGRLRARQAAADQLALNSSLPGLGAALRSNIQTQNAAGQLPKLFQPENLLKADVGSRVLQGAVFGGLPGAVGGVAGAVTPFGGAGAVVGTFAVQAISQLFDPIIKAVDAKVEEYKSSGQALAQSILSISAIGQATTQTLSASGSPTQNIGASLLFQERRASEIQQSARGKLLPLGIGGQQESTFVRGVVSALSQRGISASADQVGNISRSLAGIIQTQRPQLLDNPALLNRDLQDVLSGLPQARRTILGSLIRDTLPDLAKANSGADIEKALSSKSVFADVAAQSQNVVAVQNRLAGAQELVKTAGGEAFLNAQKPGLQFETAITNDPQSKLFAQNLGEITGNLDALGRSIGSVTGLIGSTLFNSIYGFAKNLANALPKDQTKVLEDADVVREDQVKQIQGASSRVTAKTQIDSLLGSAGLKDKVDQDATDTERSPGARIQALRSAILQFNNTPNFTTRGPGIFSELSDAIKDRGTTEGSVFGEGSQADFSKSILASEDTIPEQISTKQSQARAVQDQIEQARKEQAESEKNRIPLTRQLTVAQARLQGIRNLERNVNTRDIVTDTSAVAANENIGIRRSLADRISSGETTVTPNPLFASLQVARTKAFSDVSTIQGQLKANDTKNALGDAQINNLTDKLIESETEVLKLRHQGTEEVRKQGDALYNVFRKLSGSFDTKTAAGAQGFTQTSTPFLQKSLGDSLKVVAQDQESSKENAEVLKTIEESIKKSTEPGVRTRLERQATNIRRRADQLDTTRLIDEATVRDRQRESNDADSFARRGPQRELERLGLGLDQGTFLGAGQFAQNASNVAGLDIAANNAQISSLGSRGGSDAQRQANLETQQALRAKNSQLRIGQVDSDLNAANAPLRQAEGLAQLNIATRNLSTSITEETSKRAQLNASLETSTAALANFTKAAEAQRAGKDEQLLNLNDQIGAAGGVKPLGDLSDAQRSGIKLNSLDAQFNQLSAETGINAQSLNGNNFDRIVDSNGRGQFQSSLKEQEANLATSVQSASKELNNLTDAFAAARAALQIGINTGKRQTSASTQFGPVDLAGAIDANSPLFSDSPKLPGVSLPSSLPPLRSNSPKSIFSIDGTSGSKNSGSIFSIDGVSQADNAKSGFAADGKSVLDTSNSILGSDFYNPNIPFAGVTATDSSSDSSLKAETPQLDSTGSTPNPKKLSKEQFQALSPKQREAYLAAGPGAYYDPNASYIGRAADGTFHQAHMRKFSKEDLMSGGFGVATLGGGGSSDGFSISDPDLNLNDRADNGSDIESGSISSFSGVTPANPFGPLSAKGIGSASDLAAIASGATSPGGDYGNASPGQTELAAGLFNASLGSSYGLSSGFQGYQGGGNGGAVAPRPADTSGGNGFAEAVKQITSAVQALAVTMSKGDAGQSFTLDQMTSAVSNGVAQGLNQN
jgi:hypothetical protein